MTNATETAVVASAATEQTSQADESKAKRGLRKWNYLPVEKILEVHREEVAKGGDWKTVAARVATDKETGKPAPDAFASVSLKIQAVKNEMMEAFQKDGSTEDEARELVNSVIPSFRGAAKKNETRNAALGLIAQIRKAKAEQGLVDEEGEAFDEGGEG